MPTDGPVANLPALSRTELECLIDCLNGRRIGVEYSIRLAEVHGNEGPLKEILALINSLSTAVHETLYEVERMEKSDG